MWNCVLYSPGTPYIYNIHTLTHLFYISFVVARQTRSRQRQYVTPALSTPLQICHLFTVAYLAKSEQTVASDRETILRTRYAHQPILELYLPPPPYFHSLWVRRVLTSRPQACVIPKKGNKIQNKPSPTETNVQRPCEATGGV